MNSSFLAWSKPRHISPNFSKSVQGTVEIGTELITFHNRNGLRLVGFHDYPLNRPDSGEWMLVLPGFGETKTEVLSEAYFLAKNGFNCIRFDYAYHTGESDGAIINTTLESIKNDILSCLDFIFCEYAPKKIGALARSLASRALLRAAREEHRFDLLLNLVSIVNLQKTLFTIYQEDYVQLMRDGKSVGLMDVLGFQINADIFLGSAISDSYETLQSTIEDVRHLNAPVAFFAAEKDEWVDLEDVRHVVYAVPGKRKDLYILDSAMHELQENPTSARAALNKIIASALQHLYEPSVNCSVVHPKIREIGSRLRREKLRNRIIYEVKKDDERNFWRSYLEKYSFVVNVPDYWELMTLLYSLLELGTPQHAERVLDAGCGIGNFGTYLFVKRLYGAQQGSSWSLQNEPLDYLGLDFVEEAILQARQTHRQLEQQLISSGYRRRAVLAESYMLADLEYPLPLKPASFDKICCNLVVSYLRKPLERTNKLVELLKPGGKIVISSLKPFADLSQIYRNFISSAKRKVDIEQARNLLSNAGRIKVKEAHGVYEFFSEAALRKLLKATGLKEVETFRSLGNQANVAAGLKR